MDEPELRYRENEWSKLLEAYHGYLESVRTSASESEQEELLFRYQALVAGFLSSDAERVSILKTKLRSSDAKLATVILEYLSISDLQELFGELVTLAANTHWAVQRAHNAIQRLPLDWILARIEATSEPILVHATYDEYRRLLELYRLLDPALTRRLAERAVVHSDPDIREAGHDFLA